ncbi:MAG: hypothetical protein ACREMY_19910, partial [bacterium]
MGATIFAKLWAVVIPEMRSVRSNGPRVTFAVRATIAAGVCTVGFSQNWYASAPTTARATAR